MSTPSFLSRIREIVTDIVWRVFLWLIGKTEEQYWTLIYEQERPKHLAPDLIRDAFYRKYGTQLTLQEYTLMEELCQLMPGIRSPENRERDMIIGLVNRWWTVPDSLFSCIEKIVGQWQVSEMELRKLRESDTQWGWISPHDTKKPAMHEQIILLYRNENKHRIFLGTFNGYFRPQGEAWGTLIRWCRLPPVIY